MITARIPSGVVKINGLCSQRESIADPYVIGVGLGFSTACFLAYAFSAEDALDSFVDSRYGHLLIVDDEDDIKEYEELRILHYLGNEGSPCQLDELRILEKAISVNYFAKKELFFN